MSDTTHRHIAMILAVPVGGKVSTESVYSSLIWAGYAVTLRTVQRDLAEVGKRYGVECKNPKATGGLWWSRALALDDMREVLLKPESTTTKSKPKGQGGY